MAVQIQFRRDTATRWLENDPVLAQGEIGLELDTGRIKLGDGINIWSVLNYYSDLTSIAPLTSNWESTYTTVQDNSGDWSYQGTDIKALTANWQNTYTLLNTNSANWDSDSDNQTLSFDDNSGLLTILSGNTISLSALSSSPETDPIFTTWAQSYSANYDLTYTTVKTNSASWAGAGPETDPIFTTWAQSYSANYDLTYTTVKTNSASWAGAGPETDPIFTTWAQSYSANYDLAYHTILTGGDVGGNLNLSGSLSADSIKFNLGANITDPDQGELSWDVADQTLHFGMNGVTSRISQNEFIRIKADVAIKKGQAVRTTGASGDGSGNITGALFSAVSGGVDEIYFIGVAAEDIAVNDFGFVSTFGKIQEVKVSDTRATDDPEHGLTAQNGWAIGTILYVSTTEAGKYTQTQPLAPNRDIPCIIIVSTNGTNRGFFVRYEHGYSLNGIHDVRYDLPLVEGDLLTWNNNISAWTNRSETDPIFSTWAQTYSGKYDSTYSVVNANSANWGLDSQTLLFNEETGELSISNGNTVSLSALSGGGGGVSDGDKGDITVSSSGTSWAIDNGAVTLAKMANMATASLLGRNTSGTGAPEVLSAATAKTLLSLNNVENTALSTWAGSGNITTLGTISSGTVPVARVSGLGDAATKNTGTTAGTLAAGDDARFHNAVSLNASVADVLSLSTQEITADDPGADRLVFWDDSAGKLTHLTVGSGLSIADTTITASGGGLTNFTETLHTSSPNNTVNAAQLEVTGGTTNTDFVLTPKGTGAFIVGPEPDGTATGGNKRGTDSIDLVTSRGAASQVAGGTNAIAIGYQSTASGTRSVAISNATASATDSFAAVKGTASARSAISMGENSAASGSDSLAIGNRAAASGESSFVLGYECNATNYASFAIGRRALADRYGQFAHNGWYFTTQGDNQFSRFVLLNTTTNATPTDLLLATWSTHRLTIPSGKVFSFIAIVTGVKNGGSDVSHYVRKGCIKNIAGTTALVGSVETIGTDHEDNASTALSITADDTNDALLVTVTGIAAETWRWNAVVFGGEIIHGT